MAKIGFFQKKISHLMLVFVTIFSLPSCNMSQPFDPFSDEFINFINANNMSWKAHRVFPKNTTRSVLKKTAGADNSEAAYVKFKKQGVLSFKQVHLSDIPQFFDARVRWPVCKQVIHNPRNQGECGSCWGFSVTGAASDRLCIATKGKVKFEFSVEDIISCCSSCTQNENGCEGGFELEGWTFWKTNGMVSGGEYQSYKGCRPYSESSIRGIHPGPCFPRCNNPNYRVSYLMDKRFGALSYVLPNNPAQIQLDILQYGPLTTRLSVYEDFYNYQTGVYRYVSGDNLGKHAVKIIGWGVEGGITYWLIVNSWGRDWGEDGVFKFPRGFNYLGIEEYVTAGRVSRKLSAREQLIVPQKDAAIAHLPKVFVVLTIVLILF